MGAHLQALKARLRQDVRARIAGLSDLEQKAASARALTLLDQQAAWQEARSILFYAPVQGELNVWPLVEQSLRLGKEIALPRFDTATNTYQACQINELPRDLAPGRFGIREPTKSCGQMRLNRLDFILVPGVAFDLYGRRLGRGKGYYDQILAAARGKTCGVAFDEQIVREVPVEPHDSDVNCILTPTRWIEL